MAALACAPARVPVKIGGEEASLLLPLYVVVSGGVVALAWELWRGDVRSRELGPLSWPLAAFLGSVFGRPGVVLTGETEVKKRKDLVRQFQEDEGVPFFVLSVKAGGAGLNLTAASHVVHFDRWWNPAVENQATDRAFRIGQNKNVLVHKFICRGTVEDKIDQMIESKKQLAGDFLSAGADMLLTEMKDAELLNLVALDLSAAMREA